MKKILKILRNQAIDPTDQNLIDILRKEAKKERSNDSENTDFENDLTTQLSSSLPEKTRKQIIFPPPKWIVGLGCTCLIIACMLFSPSELRLLIPGEREKFERQMLVLDEMRETQEEIEQAVQALAKNLSQTSTFHFKREWADNLPVYQALISLADIKKELLQVSPFDFFPEAPNIDFQFLYPKSLNLIIETFLQNDKGKNP